jgi:hypothetical protein
MLQSVRHTSKSYTAKLISTQFILFIISTKLNMSEYQSSAPCLYLYNIKHDQTVWLCFIYNTKLQTKIHIHWAQDCNWIWNYLWFLTILLQCAFFMIFIHVLYVLFIHLLIFVLSTEMDSFDGFWLVLTVAEAAITLNFP